MLIVDLSHSVGMSSYIHAVHAVYNNNVVTVMRLGFLARGSYNNVLAANGNDMTTGNHTTLYCVYHIYIQACSYVAKEIQC